MRAEAAKKKEEEDAKKPTKGKPSSFFAMETDMSSNDDPNGYHKVPNQDQSMFIYTHYPMHSQKSEMILKIYELYYWAYNEEQSALDYKKTKPKKGDEYEEVRIDDSIGGGGFNQGTGGGGNQGRGAGAMTNKQLKEISRKKEEEKKQKSDKIRSIADKKKDKEEEERKKQSALSAKVKDVDPASLVNDQMIDINTALDPASLVFIGHVDAGKSTICGQIIY